MPACAWQHALAPPVERTSLVALMRRSACSSPRFSPTSLSGTTDSAGDNSSALSSVWLPLPSSSRHRPPSHSCSRPDQGMNAHVCKRHTQGGCATQRLMSGTPHVNIAEHLRTQHHMLKQPPTACRPDKCAAPTTSTTSPGGPLLEECVCCCSPSVTGRFIRLGSAPDAVSCTTLHMMASRSCAGVHKQEDTRIARGPK